MVESVIIKIVSEGPELVFFLMPTNCNFPEMGLFDTNKNLSVMNILNADVKLSLNLTT